MPLPATTTNGRITELVVKAWRIIPAHISIIGCLAQDPPINNLIRGCVLVVTTGSVPGIGNDCSVFAPCHYITAPAQTTVWKKRESNAHLWLLLSYAYS